MIKNTLPLKIQITKIKNGKVVRMYPTPRKMSLFVTNKAKTLLNKGFKINIKVFYKEGGDNEIKDCSMADLIWANKAFVKEYL